MIIANFTPDTIEWVHIGVNGKLGPNENMEVGQGRGNHILNKWGDRGLLQLQYGDEEKIEEKRKVAMKMYTRFWTYSIVVFNQHNESLKNQDKPYVMPAEQLSKHAKELGIELIGPWKLRIPVNSEEINTLKSENSDLKKILTKLSEQVSNLSKEMKDSKDPSILERETYAKKYKNKGKVQFKVYIEHNALDISTWPPERQDEARIKWGSFNFEEPFPVDVINADLDRV